MSPPTEVLSRFELEEPYPPSRRAVRGVPRMAIPHGPAGNDANCDPDAAADIDAWMRQAAAANGFGDVAAAPPSSPALRQAARAHRSWLLGSLIVTAFAALAATARRALERYRMHRHAQATCDALQYLDDRALHDLGFTRDEIRSVASELSGETEASRVRAMCTWYGSPT